MNYIFLLLISISLIIGFVNGRLEEINTSLLTSCNIAVKIAFSLIGIMAFWLGIMRIAEKAGIINIIAKNLKPITKKIFSDIPQNSPAIGDIAMSISANALGLTNAATPIGIKAMQELQEENKNKTVASDSMCMFLGMNTAGFQIIPATVIAILTGLGAKNPTDIILPTLIVTTISFIFAILISLCLKKIWHAKENHL